MKIKKRNCLLLAGKVLFEYFHVSISSRSQMRNVPHFRKLCNHWRGLVHVVDFGDTAALVVCATAAASKKHPTRRVSLENAAVLGEKDGALNIAEPVSYERVRGLAKKIAQRRAPDDQLMKFIGLVLFAKVDVKSYPFFVNGIINISGTSQHSSAFRPAFCPAKGGAGVKLSWKGNARHVLFVIYVINIPRKRFKVFWMTNGVFWQEGDPCITAIGVRGATTLHNGFVMSHDGHWFFTAQNAQFLTQTFVVLDESSRVSFFGGVLNTKKNCVYVLQLFYQTFRQGQVFKWALDGTKDCQLGFRLHCLLCFKTRQQQTQCTLCIIKRHRAKKPEWKKKRNGNRMSSSSSRESSTEIESRWNKSRYGLVVYLCILSALVAGYYFYQHAIRYTQSFDINCAAPGTLHSDIWSWDFVLQGSYSLCLLPHIILGFLMLAFWYEKILYFIFIFFTLLLVGYILGAAVFLTIQAINANTCAAIGNPFNDFRICGVCGLDVAWAGLCFDTAPYNPPVSTPLTINPPKAFQLAFTWIFFFLVSVSLVYVTSYYKNVQNKFMEHITSSAASGGGNGKTSSSAAAEGTLQTLPAATGGGGGLAKLKKKLLV